MRTRRTIYWGLAFAVLSTLTAYLLSATGADNVDQIATALRRLQTEGGEGNFAVFRLDERQNYYIQFAGAPGERKMMPSDVRSPRP
jgi:hypothetical protein